MAIIMDAECLVVQYDPERKRGFLHNKRFGYMTFNATALWKGGFHTVKEGKFVDCEIRNRADGWQAICITRIKDGTDDPT